MSIFCSNPISAPKQTCDAKSGGIEKITIFNFEKVNGEAKPQACEIECIPETSHLESVYSYSEDTRTGVWANTLFIDFGSLSAYNRGSIESLSNSYFACEVTFVDGSTASFGKSIYTSYKLTKADGTIINDYTWANRPTDGFPYPCHATAGNLASGTKMEDKQGYDLTVSVRSTKSPVIADANAEVYEYTVSYTGTIPTGTYFKANGNPFSKGDTKVTVTSKPVAIAVIKADSDTGTYTITPDDTALTISIARA